MQKFLSLAILLLLAACAVPIPAAQTQLSPTEIHTSEASPTSLPPTITPTASPEPTQTPTETPPPSPTNEPTLPALVEYDQMAALTLFDDIMGLASWSSHTPPTMAGNTLSMVNFVDAKSAVAVFYRSFMPESTETEITAARTTDGGQTWEFGETMHFACCLRSPIQLEMLDANHGWLMASDDGAMGQIPLSFFRTADGGLHWEKVYDSEEQFQIDSGNTLFGGRNPIGEHGFVLLNFDTALYATGWFYRTGDAGKSWQQVDLPIPPAETDEQTEAGMGQYQPPVSVPQFWNEQEGVTVGRYYKDLMIPPGQPTSLPVAEFLYFTSDGGLTWNYKPSPAKIGYPFFLDSQTGWYLGKSDPDPSKPSQLYQTTDGGETWEQIAAESPLPLGSEIYFLSTQTGYAVVTRYAYDYLFDAQAGVRLSYFFFTSDGGRNWEQKSLEIVP